MSTILRVFPHQVANDTLTGIRTTWYLILDCGHWYHWTGEHAPKDGDENFPCGVCDIRKVTYGTPKQTTDSHIPSPEKLPAMFQNIVELIGDLQFSLDCGNEQGCRVKADVLHEVIDRLERFRLNEIELTHKNTDLSAKLGILWKAFNDCND